MAPKKDNLPLTLDQDQDSTGTITYANEVVAVIAGVAANEVEGVAGMCAASGISEVELGTEEVSVDIYLMIEYGTPIQTAAQNVQENVRKAIETMTGLHVVRVDVHVQGVSFEKENKDTQAGLDELHSSVAEVAGHVEFEGEPTPAESHNTPDPEPIDVKDENEPEEA